MDASLDRLRGRFIVFDGGEGCGKSTQAALLRDELERRGLQVLSVRDPGSTGVGEEIRALLLGHEHADMAMRCEMLLYMAARAQMMSRMILPALAEGRVVLCDRFVSSTLAYQLGGEGLSVEQIRRVGDVAIQGRWPDLTLLLDMPVQHSSARLKRARDRIEQRPLGYHEEVRRAFLAQAAADPVAVRVIDADRPPDLVHADVLSAVAGLARPA